MSNIYVHKKKLIITVIILQGNNRLYFTYNNNNKIHCIVDDFVEFQIARQY